jgi:hypothetical protein
MTDRDIQCAGDEPEWLLREREKDNSKRTWCKACRDLQDEYDDRKLICVLCARDAEL